MSENLMGGFFWLTLYMYRSSRFQFWTRRT